jgi:hypothetical protein
MHGLPESADQSKHGNARKKGYSYRYLLARFQKSVWIFKGRRGPPVWCPVMSGGHPGVSSEVGRVLSQVGREVPMVTSHTADQ